MEFGDIAGEPELQVIFRGNAALRIWAACQRDGLDALEWILTAIDQRDKYEAEAKAEMQEALRVCGLYEVFL